MPLSIGVNLRVTGHCNQGGRKYMEDMFSVAFQPTPDDKDLEYAFFGIFDGHGGGEAATFAKEHLMDIIVKQKNFWSDRDEDVLRAIRDGYVNTHYAMWRELDKWPRTASGLPSTAGTTASIAFIRKGKIYIGHVGDSGIILGYQVDGDPQWRAKALTKDHKPESGPEMIRIQESGGKVVSKSGVPRVVWNRPRIGHKGPVRRSTHIDEIPFLAVARSLGDLWSYNSELNTFVVSPEPDVKVVAVDVKSHRCLIFGTDGLWNMLTPQSAVAIVQAADKHNEKHVIASHQTSNGQSDLQMWINPSKSLVDRALERWSSTRLRADNTSVVTLMLDPPGLTRGEILLHQKKERVLIHHGIQTPASPTATEGMEKPISNLPSPSVSRLIEIVEPKQPDSSNVIDGSIPDTLKPESTSCVEKSPPRKIETYYETKDVLIERSIEENFVDESIQVAEVSSSKILEETTEVEDKVLQTADIVKFEKLESENQKVAIKKEDEAQSETLNVPVPVQSDCKKEPVEETTEKTETVDESKPSNIMRQNAFSGTCEELKPHRTNRVRRSTGIIWERNNYTSDIELRSHILNGTRHKPLFPNSRDEVRTTKRSHSLSRQSQNSLAESGPSNSKPYMTVTSRLKLRNAKTSTANTMEETIRAATKRGNTGGIGSKRRHSAISQSAATGIEETCVIQEPSVKRRTRSEDRPSPTDENDPANQKVEDANSRLSWPAGESTFSRTAGASTTIPVQERLSSPNTFQRRSLGKKATPVKTIRRPSINGSSRLQQLRGRFGLRDWDQGRNNRSSSCNDRKMNRTVPIIGSTDATTMPQRWLRSDTIAAIKALRARDIDVSDQAISAQLIHQYGAAKQNRMSLPAKLKQSTTNGTLQSSRVKSSSLSSTKLKQTGNNSGNVGTCSTINTASTGSSSGSGIAKKVKSPYNPSARSLSTRSRIKRLGK